MLFRNPIITDNEGADHGDPFVLKHGDTYYLYHTGLKKVSLYTSKDLVRWEYRGAALEAGGADHWAQVDLWAPEVFLHEGTFYMYVAGTRETEPGKGDDHARRQGVATSKTPEGPFTWLKDPIVRWEWSIDGHPFRDDDGQVWFFYNIRTGATRYKDGTIGCGNVVDRMLTPERLEGVQAKVAYPSERWEGSKGGGWYWNEGPFVLKRRSTYYQMYSGGFFGDDTYGVGFATAPAPRGPWTKYESNPILQSASQIKGPGHHCVVVGPDGVTPYAVYHGYIPGEKGRKVHLDRLFWAGDRLEIPGPTEISQPVPPGPVYDPEVPHWHHEVWENGCRLETIQAEGMRRVLVDGVLKEQRPSNEEPPIGGALNSWLEDQHMYRLTEGAARTWAWGGTGPLELSIAVKGEALIIVDDETIPVRAESFTLIHRRFKNGAQRITAKAGPGGAAVTDLVITARPRRGERSWPELR